MADVDLTSADVYVADRYPDDRWFIMPDDTVWFQPAGGERREAIMTARDVRGNHWLTQAPRGHVS